MAVLFLVIGCFNLVTVSFSIGISSHIETGMCIMSQSFDITAFEEDYIAVVNKDKRQRYKF